MPSTTKITKQRNTDTSDLSYERMVFFSDAVMAIAITLLAIDLKLPEAGGATTSMQVWGQLKTLGSHFMSFLVSFMVIGVYWNSHHRYMNLITKIDVRLILLNMLFLLSITLMPFVSGLFGQYFYLPIGSAIYAGAIAFTGFSMKAIWLYLSHHPEMLKPEVSTTFVRKHNLLLLAGPIAFLVSIPFAWISFTAVIIVWFLTPISTFIITRNVLDKSRK